MISVYDGPHKPTYSNEFLELLIREICNLQEEGITIRGITNRFILEKLMIDTPAASYILGIKEHTGYFSCRKCCTKGESIIRPGRVSKLENVYRSIYFSELDAPERTSADFSEHFDLFNKDPHR